MKPRTFFFVAAIGVILLILTASIGLNSRRTALPTNDLPTTPEDPIALGQQIYRTRCASCHGTNLEGQPGWSAANPQPAVAPPLGSNSSSASRDDAYLIGVIRDGGQPYAAPGTMSGMPAFGSTLSAAEIEALVAFLRSR
jgi:mono/diheme cytochrome c family protein